jgi:hypothetical protein
VTLADALASAGAAQLVPRCTTALVMEPAGNPEPVRYELLTPAAPDAGAAEAVRLCVHPVAWPKRMNPVTRTARRINVGGKR